MKGTVEGAVGVNILALQKAARQLNAGVLTLDWGDGVTRRAVVLLDGGTLAVIIGEQMLTAEIHHREFRKGRFLPYLKCRACGRNCRALFVEGSALRCRRCAGLIYECQRHHARGRALLQAQRILDGLGGHFGGDVPARKPGKWRKTYYRQILRLSAAYEEAAGGTSGKTKRSGVRNE
ncbi:hypothetical protein E4K72_15275 [Oxalobacteraceae bacterium OM1]|nr:hypothetical protein E4K72_15275 [Oxalobacteraceae bacterium OM1]